MQVHALDDPFSVWYGLAYWAFFIAYILFGSVLALRGYKRSARGTWSRWFSLLTALVQFVSIVGLAIQAIMSLVQHNYAAAAAFGTAGALLFTGLKLMGGGVLAAVGADIYHKVKAWLFKPKASTNPPDA